VPGAGVIVNGSFQNGLNGWTTGEVGFIPPSVGIVHPPDGTNSVLLGNPSIGGTSQNTCAGGVPIGSVWIAQTIIVPTGSPTLTFEYNL
jgi:hypothetical protein